MTDLQWLVGGEAGYGIMTSGATVGKIFTRLGLSVFDYVEYPSLIRGGHNAYYVRGADFEISSQKKPVDILVALNRDTIDKHKSELSSTAAIIFDPNVVKIEPSEFGPTILLCPVPLLEITKQLQIDRLMINTVSIGASLALFSSDFSVLEQIMKDVFGRKGEQIVTENVNATKAGFDFVTKEFASKFAIKVQKTEQKNLLIGGGEAVAFGAIRAGVKAAYIYPMTPINSIMITLTANALKYNIVTKEPEDEIAGLNMAIGSGFAGVRSMVATSGGGFSLMVEAVGLASQTETPVVIVMGMRPGPATGMPTWTGQGDLRFVMHAAQDDFPRVVLVPGDFEEAFEYSMKAFNLAEKYQMPVILLVDKYLMEGHGTVAAEQFKVQSSKFKVERGKILSDEDASKETDYKRYLLTDDGISPRSIPGQKGAIALSGSDEHDERGLYDEEAENRTKMMDKRFKKLETMLPEIPGPEWYGNPDAPLTLVLFGSTKLPAMEAMRWLQKENINVNILKISYILPFRSDLITPELKKAKKTLILEGNKTGQLEGLIREKTGMQFEHNFRKYDGRPFYPEEIVAKVKELI